MTVNLVIPQGQERELCSHGQRGYIPFRYIDQTGRQWWLVQVDDQAARYFFGPGGFYPAPDEVQSAQPPGGLAYVERFNDLRAGVRSDEVSGGSFSVVPLEV
jgi:hypothetical protein